MSGYSMSCRIEECKHYGKIEYVELDRFKRHLAQDHDRNDLIELALQEGLITDPLRNHSFSFIISQIAQYCKVNKP